MSGVRMPGAQILIVEDNAHNLELATDLLEVAGHTVLQARSAEEGLRLAHAERPDLVLMDVRLPGMDGLAAVRLLKGDVLTRAIPVVALTAQAMKGDETKARQAGFDGYLTKPIDARSFAQSVARFLDRSG